MSEEDDRINFIYINLGRFNQDVNLNIFLEESGYYCFKLGNKPPDNPIPILLLIMKI